MEPWAQLTNFPSVSTATLGVGVAAMRMKERAGYERSTDLKDSIPVDNRVWWTKHLGSSNTSYFEFLFYNSN